MSCGSAEILVRADPVAIRSGVWRYAGSAQDGESSAGSMLLRSDRKGRAHEQRRKSTQTGAEAAIFTLPSNRIGRSFAVVSMHCIAPSAEGVARRQTDPFRQEG
jgi:hypothetical protein